MKKIILTFSVFLFSVFLFRGAISGQSNPYKIFVDTLDNGLIVFLNEDTNQTNISAQLVVRAGSVNDPDDAYGLAHYFEHMMFKGTDKIGALNYKMEKPLLDSICVLYDALNESSNTEKLQIQYKLRKVSEKVAGYSNPTEFNTLLESIGCTDVNAHTSYEYTTYESTIPKENISLWLEILSEQFRNPVFRDFQSELQTIYNEKSSYEDLPYYRFTNHFRGEIYMNSPYGHEIIGAKKNLLLPSVSRLKEFFETYYVANNMALILTGNFEKQEVINEIENHLGKLIPKPIAQQEEFKSRIKGVSNLKTVFQTPEPTLFIGFNKPDSSLREKVIYELCLSLLLNSSQTGLLDRYVGNRNVNSIEYFNLAGQQYAVECMAVFAGINNKSSVVGSNVIQIIHQLKEGGFEDEDLDYVKKNYSHLWKLKTENITERAYLIRDAFIGNYDLDEIITLGNIAENVSRDDVIDISTKYFNSDYTTCWSKPGISTNTGMPLVETVENEDKNSDKLSEYGKDILNKKFHIGSSDFIEIGTDVLIDTLDNNNILYSTKNPYNDIYTLTIKFSRNMADKRIEPALMLVQVSGTKRRPISTYMTSMRNCAANYEFDCDFNNIYITISGKEEYFKDALNLLVEKIKYPAPKNEQLLIVKSGLVYKKMRKNYDPIFSSLSLMEYIRTGSKSFFGTDLSTAEINKLTVNELVDVFGQTLNYKADFLFSGNIPLDTLKSILVFHFSDSVIKTKDEKLKREILRYEEPLIFTSKNSGSQHNRIISVCAGDTIRSMKEMAIAYCFEKYFGQGQLSILSESLRTNMQLSYDYFCKGILEPNIKEPYSFFCYVGTKYQNTYEVLSEINKVLISLPVDTLYFELSKQRAINDLLDEAEDFRKKAPYMAYYYDLGYKSDPRKELIGLINEVTLDEILEFHKKHLSKSVKLYGIIGSSKGMIKSRLKSYGKPVKLSNNQFLVM